MLPFIAVQHQTMNWNKSQNQLKLFCNPNLK